MWYLMNSPAVMHKCRECRGEIPNKEGAGLWDSELVELQGFRVLIRTVDRINSQMAAVDENESKLLIQIEDGLDETNSDVRIFGIAHPLWRLRPESYIPQVISIGPYHYKKLKQYEETDAYKRKMARALERDFSPFKFSMLVECIRSLEGQIRVCYHKHIPYETEELSRMLAFDTSFILQFLVSSYRVYDVHVKPGSRLMHEPTILHSQRKTPLWYAMKNDMLMLENQVPMFMLIEALCVTANCIQSETQVERKNQKEKSQDIGRFRRARSQSKIEISPDLVRSQEIKLHLAGILQAGAQSKLEISPDLVRSQEKLHLAGILQASAQSQIEISPDLVRSQEKLHLAGILQAACLHFNPFVREKNYLPPAFDVETKSHVLDYLYGFVTSSKVRHNSKSQNIACGSVLSLFKKSFFKKALIHHAGGIDGIKTMISAKTAGDLPSATELSEAGIKFSAYDSGDLKEIRFDRKTSTLLLPKIKMDDSTEVVLRNLVALELNLVTEQKPLTRYTYLMDRLIDTKTDVAVLRKCGILISQMGSDEEVAQMWNSISKSTWENTFDPVDKAIEEAKKHYSSKWRVLLAEFLKKHCSKPWLVIAVLSAAILLSLTAVQVFCLFYTCNKKSASN